MRIVASFCLAFAVVCSCAADAQDLPTTTEHGITITPDDLTTAIQDTQDFWGPVRKHLLSSECTIGTPEEREQALAFLKRVHDGLHHRLFEMGEAEAVDLVDYLGHRLRMFEVYRRIRTTLSDDALTADLIAKWERDLREIHLLPEAERPAKIPGLLTTMTERLKAAGVSGEKFDAVVKLWTVQSDVVEKMAATGAGKAMLGWEREGYDLDKNVGDLLVNISLAADWVLIVREPMSEIGREQFLSAWTALAGFREKATASAGAAVNR